MVWNKTPDAIAQEIYKVLKSDFSLTYKQVADQYGVSEWLVGELWRKLSTPEEKQLRYSQINHHAKLGTKNPMFGKLQEASPKASKKDVYVCGYKAVWMPDWWEGLQPKPNRVYEHQLVWAQAAGCTYVPKGSVVHHIDGNKLNNSVDNLQCMTRSEHMSHHAKERATTRRKAVGNSVPEAQDSL
jgi:hypothetical protein